MTFQWAAFTGQLDPLHAVLAGLTLLFLILFLAGKKRPKPKAPIVDAQAATQESTQVKETTPPAPPSKDAAFQLLSLFQQEGRLIDFLHEDLTGFSDEEIGAAARVVHQGSRKVLDQYFSLSPVRKEAEESSLTLEASFDNRAIQLTGQVTGEAPYKGTLIHKGWQVDDCRLPQLAKGHSSHILAKAEVEL